MFSDLVDNITCGWEGKGARTASFFIPKDAPIDNMGRIKNSSILFIHGDDDWVVKDRHSRKLYNASVCNKAIEIIKGGLHAERLIQHNADKIKGLILGWFAKTLARGKPL
jgi:hypothetical protein